MFAAYSDLTGFPTVEPEKTMKANSGNFFNSRQSRRLQEQVLKYFKP
jgi:hypothetical protein